MKKQKLAMIGLGIMSALILGACSSQSASPEATEAPSSDGGSVGTQESGAEGGETSSPEGAQLTFWYWADNTEQSNLIKTIVDNFNNSNEYGIQVTAEEYPWNGGGFSEDTFTAIMGGGGPDISTFKLSAGKMYAANGLLADMTSYVDAWEDKDQIRDSIWQIMKDSTGNDQLNVLPWTLEPLYVYYRPSYFEQAGVEVPETFDEWLACIEACTMDTDGDGITDIYGYGMRGGSGGQEHLGSFLYAYGADWNDLTTPEAVEAYQAYLDIYNNGWAPESAPNAGYAEIVDGFKSGLTAMFIHHIGSSNEWIEAFGDDVSAFVMPGSDKGQWTCTGDTQFVVYEQCENKDAAFEFVKYMTTGEGGTEWFKGTGKGLGTDNVTSTEEFAANPFQEISAASLEIAGVLPPTDTVSEFINSVWANTNQQALLGELDTAGALEVMNQSLNGTE